MSSRAKRHRAAAGSQPPSLLSVLLNDKPKVLKKISGEEPRFWDNTTDGKTTVTLSQDAARSGSSDGSSDKMQVDSMAIEATPVLLQAPLPVAVENNIKTAKSNAFRHFVPVAKSNSTVVSNPQTTEPNPSTVQEISKANAPSHAAGHPTQSATNATATTTLSAPLLPEAVLAQASDALSLPVGGSDGAANVTNQKRTRKHKVPLVQSDIVQSAGLFNKDTGEAIRWHGPKKRNVENQKVQFRLHVSSICFPSCCRRASIRPRMMWRPRLWLRSEPRCRNGGRGGPTRPGCAICRDWICSSWTCACTTTSC